MNRRLLVLFSAGCAWFSARAADAHVTVASGPAIANATQLVTFQIGHGCPGADDALLTDPRLADPWR